MAQVVTPRIKFRPPASADVTRYRLRQVAEYTAGFVEVPEPPTDADGFARIPVSSIGFLAGVEGDVTIYLTAVDAVGNESDFLAISGPLDVSPPAAPTAGEIESSV